MPACQLLCWQEGPSLEKVQSRRVGGAELVILRGNTFMIDDGFGYFQLCK